MAEFRAGWYKDWSDERQQRYFNGEAWTDYVRLIEPPESETRWWRRRRRTPKVKPARQLVDAAYRMLFADKAMVGLLAAGAMFASLAGAAVLVPAMRWGDVKPDWSEGGVLGVAVAGLSFGVTSFVIQLTCAAVVAAALLRAEGRPATVRDALRVAWSRRWQLLAWTLVSAVVGALARMLNRLGIGGIIASFVVDVGWSLTTVFATPVVIVEGTMPLATVRRSAGLVRQGFTTVLVTQVAMSVPWVALCVAAIVIGIVGGFVLFAGGATATVVGLLLMAGAAVTVFFAMSVFSALSAYLQAFLYRHANGLPVSGVDRLWLPPFDPS
ncbi:DUF6159 family protein [Nocardioides sp. Iso805N]|uniref:DUF6159 family protein n=1 Tax=Nocardioides sp. Iso805N TaxID=1283287 RepID=UPI00036D622D|nr:DUF6159 family protein [Nocardioides sp. Iso805N]